MKRGLLCGASAAVVTIVAGLSGSQALAQAVAAPAAADTGTGGNVEIVATKRTEKLEQVPVAVSAFSAKQRNLLGIKSIQDLSDFTPGLAYYGIANRPYIRGIGRNTDNLASAPSVASYVDGVYIGANASTILQEDTLFIDRIEVDRGPQSTLFGRNSDGGVINYISRRPTADMQEEVRVGVANYGKYYGEGLISGPINDHMRFLVGGNYTEQNGGYFNNLDGPAEGGDGPQGNNGTSHFVEAQVEGTWDKLDWWAKASSGDYRTSFHTVQVYGVPGDYEFPSAATLAPSGFFGLCSVAGNTGIGCTGAGSGPDTVVPGSVVGYGPGNLATTLGSSHGLRDFISDGPPQEDDQRNDLALATTLTYHFPGADLRYTGGYQSFYYHLNFTSGATAGVQSYQLTGPSGGGLAACQAHFAGTPGLCAMPATVFPADTNTRFIEDEQFFSHELDLTSTYQGPLQYIAGLYWYHDHYDQPVDVLTPQQPQLYNPVQLLGGAAAPFSPLGGPFLSDTNLTSDSYAGFFQLDWKATQTIKLTGGLRYTWDTKAGTQQERLIAYDLPFTGLFNPFYLAAASGANTPGVDITQFVVGGATCATKYPGAGLCYYNAKTGFEERNLSGNWNALTGTAGVEWTPDSHTLAYAKYSRGYKTGGFSTNTIGAFPEDKPEYVDAYEGGVKLSHNIWQLNATVFYYNFQNDQQPLTVVSTGSSVSNIFNIPTVHTWGVELEGIWHPIEPLVINAQYSYLSAKVASSVCAVDAVDPNALEVGANQAPGNGCVVGPAGAKVQQLNGQTLPESAPNKVSIDAIYTFNWDPGSLALAATYVWKDKTYGTVFNRPDSLAPAYSNVDLRATWTDAKNRYTITGFVDNVFNTTGFDSAPGGALLTPAAITPEVIDRVYSLTAPTTYGIEFQYRWR